MTGELLDQGRRETAVGVEHDSAVLSDFLTRLSDAAEQTLNIGG